MARGEPGYPARLHPLALAWWLPGIGWTGTSAPTANHRKIRQIGGTAQRLPPLSTARTAAAGPGGQSFRRPPLGLRRAEHAGAEQREHPGPARAGRRPAGNGSTDSEDPRFKRRGAQRPGHAPKRSFLLDRPLRSRWRLCRLRMRRTPCGCGPFVSGPSAAADAAVGLRHAPAGAVFSARQKRKWGVECSGHRRIPRARTGALAGSDRASPARTGRLYGSSRHSGMDMHRGPPRPRDSSALGMT